ncbi:MAG: transcription-repair coupling factor [Bacteroidales bacterium]|nr:transcription-repair coupling factor [Bacteroidales bacterium]
MLIDYYLNHPIINELLKTLTEGNQKINIKKFKGSSLSFFISAFYKISKRSILFISHDIEHALYVFSDIHSNNCVDNLFFFPSSFKRKIKNNHFTESFVVLRNKCLNALTEHKHVMIISYPEALLEKLPEDSNATQLKLKVGDKIDIDFLEEFLQEYNFTYSDFVTTPGEYSRRGMLIDVFSYSSETPYRIEIRNDIVYSIRNFDVETQVSDKKLNEITIVPNVYNNKEIKLTKSFFDFIPSNTIIITNDFAFFEEKIKTFTQVLLNDNVSCFTYQDILTYLNKFIWLNNGMHNTNCDYYLNVDTSVQPSFNKNFDIFKENINYYYENFYKVYLSVHNEAQKQRIEDILKNINLLNKLSIINNYVSYGFIDDNLKILCYTEHEFNERFIKHKLQDKIIKNYNIILDEFYSLKPGDYVVHCDHGIGIFGGIEKIEVNGKVQEKIKIVFKDNALLYVSINNIHKITKYKSSNNEQPKLSKLGSGAWIKLKEQTKNKVKDIARDLIKLYAARLKQKGFAFSPDSYLQEELESSFFYEDTPDQYRANKEIKQDMEKPYPMDRLICGDVGFGKTELAIRAAFKAVADNKQVAVLVPTTILAFQHYLTFKERLAKFPVNIEYLTRKKSNTEVKKILENLKTGKIDIIIGTHKLLGKDVAFKDLGLLIIDEEQKFGVAHKEHLRKLKTNVDTLTLTATPIPRTLHFSLIGARDISILQTPPLNRQPIVTEVHVYNEQIIKEAIEFEISREGQVFFIHNRIETIYHMYNKLRNLMPSIRITVAHGRMKPVEIEDIILKFMEGDYDVLLCTTIIENGIDIPNANTIIINDGHLFGLSDLHQLRGRVGRTNRKAYCYILVPPFDTLSTEAQKRLKAIEEYSDLGSGFYIAMHDLEIRGAGNLLGAEQSGFIAEMGYDTYLKILQEAIEELKIEEGLTNVQPKENEKKAKINCIFESDGDFYIPENYISNTAERIKLYRELDSLTTDDEINNLIIKVEDRFGPIPEEFFGLFKILKIRQIGSSLGFEKIVHKNNQLICFFPSNKNSEYYETNIFKEILNFLKYHHLQVNLKEKNNKLYLIFSNINNLDKVFEILSKVNSFVYQKVV